MHRRNRKNGKRVSKDAIKFKLLNDKIFYYRKDDDLRDDESDSFPSVISSVTLQGTPQSYRRYNK